MLVHVAFKAAVSMKNDETSVTDCSRSYPDGLCCYCIQILLTEPSYSRQENTQHKKLISIINSHKVHIPICKSSYALIT